MTKLLHLSGARTQQCLLKCFAAWSENLRDRNPFSRGPYIPKMRRNAHHPLHVIFNQALPPITAPPNRLNAPLSYSNDDMKNGPLSLLCHWPDEDVTKLSREGRLLGRWAKEEGSGGMDTRPGSTPDLVTSEDEAGVTLRAEREFQRTADMVFMDLQRACGRPGQVRDLVHKAHVNIDRL